MTAPLENQFWKRREVHKGAPPKYDKPEDLETACVGYFDWVADNPIIAIETATFQGYGNTFEVPKRRAMTIKGLCIHIGVSETTWYAWRDPKDTRFRKDVRDIQQWAEAVIYQWKLEGAAAGLLNPAIISRELGLTDKAAVEVEGKVDVVPDKVQYDLSKVPDDVLKGLMAGFPDDD